MITLSYRRFVVEELAVVPNQLYIAEALLDSLICGSFEVGPHSPEVHGLLDDHGIVKESKASLLAATYVVDRSSELNRISVLEELLQYLVALAVILFVDECPGLLRVTDSR